MNIGTPHRCPACDGRGSHPGSAPRKRIRCRGCTGTGIVWAIPPAKVEPFPLIPFIPMEPPRPPVLPLMPLMPHPDLGPTFPYAPFTIRTTARTES
jgi:hypothetical protein